MIHLPPAMISLLPDSSQNFCLCSRTTSRLASPEGDTETEFGVKICIKDGHFQRKDGVAGLGREGWMWQGVRERGLLIDHPTRWEEMAGTFLFLLSSVTAVGHSYKDVRSGKGTLCS